MQDTPLDLVRLIGQAVCGVDYHRVTPGTSPRLIMYPIARPTTPIMTTTFKAVMKMVVTKPITIRITRDTGQTTSPRNSGINMLIATFHLLRY
jgi:hypothetical protein